MEPSQVSAVMVTVVMAFGRPLSLRESSGGTTTFIPAPLCADKRSMPITEGSDSVQTVSNTGVTPTVVQGAQGQPGPTGPAGPAGTVSIVVGGTPPANPNVNIIWIDTGAS